MNENTGYFICECVAYARTLPISRSVDFLRGLLLVADPRATDLNQVRSALNKMTECDQQLELIASGQIKLALAPEPKARK